MRKYGAHAIGCNAKFVAKFVVTECIWNGFNSYGMDMEWIDMHMHMGCI